MRPPEVGAQDPTAGVGCPEGSDLERKEGCCRAEEDTP